MHVAVFTAERRLAPAALWTASSSRRIPVFASSSKCLAPKDHAEVCSITRAVILTKIVGRNGYPDYCDQALAFSAILYPASLRHSLRVAFRTGRRRSGLPSSAFILDWTLAKIRPYSDGRLCSLSNFRQHHPDPDANCIFSSGGGRYLFDIEPLLDRRL